MSGQLRSDRFNGEERTPGTHWIGGWVGLRADMDAMGKRKILLLPGIETRCSARGPSLYRLSYLGSACDAYIPKTTFSVRGGGWKRENQSKYRDKFFDNDSMFSYVPTYKPRRKWKVAATEISCWASWIHSTSWHPTIFLRIHLKLACPCLLSSCLFPSGNQTNILHALLAT
jgi:hypothetical protein